MRVQSSDIFTQRVNALMKQNFLTKKDMAERLNVDYSTFWRKLNGQRNVDMVLLKRIAEILGTSTAYLIGETDNPSPVVHAEHEQKGKQYVADYAYWGGVVNNVQQLLAYGDERDISSITSLIKLAYEMLTKSVRSNNSVKVQMPILGGINNKNTQNVNIANT